MVKSVRPLPGLVKVTPPEMTFQPVNCFPLGATAVITTVSPA